MLKDKLEKMSNMGKQECEEHEEAKKRAIKQKGVS